MDRDLVVHKSIDIKAANAAVWDALINPEKIKLYLFGTEAISDWKLGSWITFQGEYQGHKYKDKGLITEVIDGKVFEYDYWTGFSGLKDAPENYSLVRFELNTQGNTTSLSVIQTGFVAEENQEHSEEGWAGILEEIKKIAEGAKR